MGHSGGHFSLTIGWDSAVLKQQNFCTLPPLSKLHNKTELIWHLRLL